MPELLGIFPINCGSYTDIITFTVAITLIDADIYFIYNYLWDFLKCCPGQKVDL